MSSIEDEKLLLADYSHFGDGIFKNEEIGERRIEFFLTVATAVLGGVVFLLTSEHVRLQESDIRRIALAALLGLFLMGLVTFSRILQRDKVTDEYKRIQRYLREQLRKRSVSLQEYSLPFSPPRDKLLRGGLALITAVMNSVVLAFFAGVLTAGKRGNIALTGGGFLLAFVFHAWAIGGRSDRSEFYRAGAGAVILNSKGQVLALKRRKLADAWQLPQGGLNPGEPPLEAALREINEETGIKGGDLRQLIAEPVLLPYELPPKYRSHKTGRGQVHHWFLFRYHGLETGISLDGARAKRSWRQFWRRVPAEFDEWKWTTLQELATEVVPFRREVYQELLKRWASELSRASASTRGGAGL